MHKAWTLIWNLGLNFLILFFHVYVCMHICMCTIYVPGTCIDQMGSPGTLIIDVC